MFESLHYASTDVGSYINTTYLAEALLRIPDAQTADRLIADRLGAGNWERHLGASDSLFVNASTWGLMLTGRMAQLERTLAEVAATGYGLTFGIQSRIEGRSRDISERVAAGNIYVNRNMIGAVVGAQPFGGRGLSGTGPKAGGPHYLSRFVMERTVSVNTAAIGGNLDLLTLMND